MCARVYLCVCVCVYVLVCAPVCVCMSGAVGSGVVGAARTSLTFYALNITKMFYNPCTAYSVKYIIFTV